MCEWVVYSKKPFGGAGQALRYLSRYTHKVAISNSRILCVANGKVKFLWKDYRTGKQKVMTLEAEEFIRRFLVHVLPRGFQRIRFYGLLAAKHRKENPALCRALLGRRPSCCRKSSAVPN